MLLAATSEAVMCLSFPFMQLTLSSHWLQPYTHLQLTPHHRDVMASVGASLHHSPATAGEKCLCMS